MHNEKFFFQKSTNRQKGRDSTKSLRIHTDNTMPEYPKSIKNC